jgi:3-oxoacyl-[acyl-carrier protein] reductase
VGVEGRVALVTGATSGIGEATAHTLAARGARVAVAGRDADRGRAVVAAITAAGGEAAFVPHDLADPHGGEAVVAATVKALGQPRILVSNAGTFFFGPTPDVTPDEFDLAMRVNLIGSSGGSVGVAMTPLYAMTKAALKGLMVALVPEWGSAGVTFNVVEPGLVETPLTAPMTGTEEQREQFFPHHPTGRIGVPQDIAHAIAMFADDDAEHINAQVLLVDGGNTATAKHSALPPPPGRL